MRSTDRLRLALAWMLTASIAFSTMFSLVKVVSSQIPVFEIVFFRSALSLVVVVAIMMIRGESFKVSSNKNVLILRGVAGFGGASCLFYALGHLPIGISSILQGCSPLFVIVFSRLFLKENVPGNSWIWIALSFCGVILISRPDLSESGASALPFVPVAIGILGAASGGLAYVAVRAATAQVSVNMIVLYFSGIATLLSLPLAARDFVWPEPEIWPHLFAMGGVATLAQVAMTQGYRFAPAPLASTMSLVNAGIAALFGLIFFGEILLPVQWLGMAVLGCALTVLSFGQVRHSKL